MKTLLLIILCFSIVVYVSAQNLYFPPIAGSGWESTSPQSLNWCGNKVDSLYNFLEEKNTKAFILLKDGKIVLEKYFGSHTQSDPWYWASAGKTLTAFMTGIAQQENLLSLSDSTSKYLGRGWTKCTPEQERMITLRHQLTMTSGLDDAVADHHCTLDTCLIYKSVAGTRWAYHNAPYTLLDVVIENATGATLNSYTNQKLKIPTGITGTFVKVGYNNVYFSNARSMARFGLLILNKGNWNGNQIMTDADFFNQMVSSSQSLNNAYGYLWWLNGKSNYMVPGSQFVFNGFLNPDAPADMIAALGKNGQFLNVVPDQNLVWVRMGEAPDGGDVPFLLNNQIWQYLNSLECNPSGSTKIKENDYKISVYSDPATGNLTILSDRSLKKVVIFSLQGQVLKVLNIMEDEGQVTINDLKRGGYITQLHLKNGETVSKKLIY